MTEAGRRCLEAIMSKFCELNEHDKKGLLANDGQMRKSHDCAAFKLNSLKKKEDSK